MTSGMFERVGGEGSLQTYLRKLNGETVVFSTRPPRSSGPDRLIEVAAAVGTGLVVVTVAGLLRS